MRSLDAGAGCYQFALVTGGLFAGCYLQPDGISPHATPTLITYRGGQSLFPKGIDISEPWFGTGDGDLVALGRVTSADPLAANPVGATQLLVLQPPSATPKKAINLAGITPESVGPGGSTVGDATFLKGLSATTAVISVRQNAQAAGAASPTQRLVAFDLGGTRRWDVTLPPGAADPQVRVTGAGVLVSAEVRGSTSYLSLRRLGDGTPIWEATRPVGLPVSGPLRRALGRG